MKKLVKDAGLEHRFKIESCATSTEEIWGGVGNPIYPPAQAELRKRGIPFDASKRARQLKRSEYNDWDLLVVMDEMNLRNALRILGSDPEQKLHRLLEYAGRSGSVADPWYSGDFRQAYEDIEAGCRGILELYRA